MLIRRKEEEGGGVGGGGEGRVKWGGGGQTTRTHKHTASRTRKRLYADWLKEAQNTQVKNNVFL